MKYIICIKNFHVKLDEISQTYVTKRIKQNTTKRHKVNLFWTPRIIKDNLRIYFISTKCSAYIYECVPHVCRTLGGQGIMSDRTGGKMLVNLMYMRGIKPKSSVKTARALNS